jgi:hypothetical protein
LKEAGFEPSLGREYAKTQTTVGKERYWEIEIRLELGPYAVFALESQTEILL